MFKVPTVTPEQVARGYIGYMPSMDAIPERFKDWNSNDLYLDFVSEWFFNGVDPLRLTPRDDISRLEVIPLIKNVLGSREPKHEHKIAAVAYMLYSWFLIDGEDTRYPLTVETLDRLYKLWTTNSQEHVPKFCRIDKSFGEYFCDTMGMELEQGFLDGRKDIPLYRADGPTAYQILSDYIKYKEGDVAYSRCDCIQAKYAIEGDATAVGQGTGIIYWHRYKKAAKKDAKNLKAGGCTVKVKEVKNG